MAGVLLAHDADGIGNHRGAAGPQVGEDDLFFLFHVVEQFYLGLLQQVRQSGGHGRVVTMHGFDTARHADQFGQLLAVHGVVTLQDVVDQFGGSAGGRRIVAAVQRGQLLDQRAQVDLLVQRGLAQADLAAATEVQLQTTEDRRGARQGDRDLANGLVHQRGGDFNDRGLDSCVHGMAFFKIHLRCIYCSIKCIPCESLTLCAVGSYRCRRCH
ncbi:MAG: hypothetical protein BWX79_02837 [Alphaproteobacteria bacterium ADurb.Bin100]|nr:MAG: hypothetical protein BWX79_02837 [Alphaproteobacteria bacterium ADurb.Bin100]